MVSRGAAPVSRTARILAPFITRLEAQGLSGAAALQTLRNTLRSEPYRDAATGTVIRGIRTQQFYNVFRAERQSSTFASGLNTITRRYVPDVVGFAISPFRQRTKYLIRTRVPIRIKETGQTLIRNITVTYDDERELSDIAREAAQLAAPNPISSEVDIDRVEFVGAYIKA